MKLPPVSWARAGVLPRVRLFFPAQRHAALFFSGLVVTFFTIAATPANPTNSSEPRFGSARPHAPNEPLECSEKGPLSINVEAAWDNALTGAQLPANITVQLEANAASIRLRTRGEGVLADSARVYSLGGPWSAGASRTMNAVLPLRGAGMGRAEVTAEALDASGKVLYMRRVDLYALLEGNRLWGSYSSETDLLLWRAQALAASGVLDAKQAQAAVEAVIDAKVVADSRPLNREKMTPAEQRLQHALDAIAPGFARQQTMAPSSGEPPAAPATITVSGKVQWTDKAGGKHGVPMATVEIRDEDLIGSELITTVMTDAAGNYTSTFTHDDGILQGDPDIFVRVLARSAIGDIKPDAAGATTYMMDSPTMNEVPNNSNLTINLTAGNSADNETVFGVHHSLVMIGAYAGGLAGSAPSQVDVRFPTTRSTSLFDSGAKQLHILKLDRFDWDVIHHEYGHYFQNIHGFQANPGGMHSFNTHLAQTRGSKDIGVRLAWGEGWPTFFGTSGQNVSGAAGLMIPNVGDVSYTDTEDSTNNLNLETSTGVGEDDEVSSMSALWDLFDAAADGADQSTFGDKFLFTTFKGAAVTTIGAAWEAIAATLSTQQKTVVGGLFGQAKIAPELTAPADNFNAGAAPPTFTWVANGGGAPNPLNDFKIQFYKNDFSAVIFEKDLGNVTTYTPTMADWATILGGDSVVKWVVEGKNTSAPATPGGTLGRYWSRARTIGGISIIFVIDDTGSMGEEIDGVKNALQSFIDVVVARGGTPPTIQLITFKDNVTTRITSNDLAAVRTAVGTLFASGGNDCPEASAQALQVAAGNVSPGGTILLATDASSQPGVDNGAVVAQLRAKRVTLNTVLSGDCTGIPTIAVSGAQAEDGSLAVPPIRYVSGGKVTAFGIFPQKPGDDDPPQDPIIDPGQPPPDEGGDTPSTGTALLVDQEQVRGLVGLGSDAADYFVVHLEAGGQYAITGLLEAGSGVTFTLYDTDGTTQLGAQFAGSTVPVQILRTPTTTGDYFVAVTRTTGASPSAYRLRVANDPFAFLNTAVKLFSTMSVQTGGAFIVRDDVNSGNTAAYEAAIFNIMISSLGPSVLLANSDELPRDATLSIELVGRGTNWGSGTTVAFSGEGITVMSVTVSSATRLSALLSVSSGATLGFRDVTVETPLGSATETAPGRDVVEVVPTIIDPTLLSVEPNTAIQGQTVHIVVRGINTTWDNTSVLSLGPGITVQSPTVVSPTLIEADIVVDSAAAIGFRQANVTTGTAVDTKLRAIFVNSTIGVLPEIESVTPNTGEQGRQVDVDIVGSNTNFENGVTTASFGEGIDIVSVTVTDATHAKVRVSIALTAPIGFRSVLLTTGSEVAVKIDSFFVSETTGPSPLLNIAGRFNVTTGARVGIGGFIISGSDPKTVVIRGIGPSLTSLGVPGALADPMLRLFSQTAMIGENNDWKETQETEITATGLAPTNVAESAILKTLDPGAYTAILTGVGGTTGIGLVEIYDAGGVSTSRLGNLSARGFINTGDRVLIGGLITGTTGTGQARLLIRAVGPSLAGAGLTGVVLDPTLEIYNANGDVLASNDNWKSDDEANIQATTLAPADDREAAVITTVTPGNHTAVVRGKNGTTGLALVEVFALP